MNRYKVTVMENTYYITTDDSEAWVRSLEDRIALKVSEIRDGNPSLSALDTAALLALNLMDELKKSEESASNLRSQLTSYLRESSAARSQDEELRRLGQTAFSDYGSHDEAF